MSDVYVCSNCGTEAGVDSRVGSASHYLTCQCATKGYWVNDGRGGYWQSIKNATPIPVEQYNK